MEELYCSTDIEADGPIPGIYSMLSIGTAVYRGDKTVVDTFSANLLPLPGAQEHPDTMEFWKLIPDTLQKFREKAQDPFTIMQQYISWITSLPGTPVFVGFSFDYLFLIWYAIRFTGINPFGHSAIDIRGFAMGVLGTNFEGGKRSNLPKHILPDMHHLHTSLEDALEQGEIFCNLLAARAKLDRCKL